MQKTVLSRPRRLLRLIGGVLDPRAWAHAVKIVNYYNYTHVQELRLVTRGPDCAISPTASFANGHNVVLGRNVLVSAHACLWAGPGRARITVGDDTMIASGVMVTATNYRFNDGAPINAQAMDESDVEIGADVWIGYGAVVLPGTRIGDGAVIGAGAVVRGEIPPGTVMASSKSVQVGQRSRPGAAAAPSGSGPANPDVADAVARATPTLDATRRAGPVDRCGLDSFDLITLRTEIETVFGRSIPDAEWAGIAGLDDIARLPSLADARTDGPATLDPAPSSRPASDLRPTPAPLRPAPAPTPSVESRPPGQATRRYRLNMPQMALSGLSESWVFKEAGDLHWQMITNFLGSESSAISDEAGNRLYATFTRITLNLASSLRDFRENAPLAIESDLSRFGAGVYFGHHTLSTPEAGGELQTMSTFAKYGERGRNTTLIKGTPALPDPARIPALPEMPDFGLEYRTRRSAEVPESRFECTYEPLPPHDINGVGLFYFAAYPTVIDLCLERAEGKGFLMSHSTVAKDICYFANSEPDDTLTFRLHAREMTEAGLIRHVASLARGSDGVRMAEVISLKRPL